MKDKFDFAGWVTKNDIRCSDGVVIRHNAFHSNDSKKVPLVWEHNHTSPDNVLGYVQLSNRDSGVYGYGYFNDSEQANNAKELVRHGDVMSMSIGANKIVREGNNNVVSGNIYEVSLVLAGANPGAVIDSVITHSADGVDEEKAIIITDQLLHSAENPDDEEDGAMKKDQKISGVDDAKTLTKDILAELTPEEQADVKAYIKSLVGDAKSPEELQSKITPEIAQKIMDHIMDILGEGEENEEDDEVKQNIFAGNSQDDYLEHSQLCADILADAQATGSLKTAMIQHGINNIDQLLTVEVTTGAPEFIRPEEPSMVDKILSSVKSTPKHSIRGRWADITNQEARAKGYVKGHEKFEESFGHWNRETFPQTIYKKQSLDNDDIIDITDFDVVAWLRGEMRDMWRYELARAIFIPDGRGPTDQDKIKEDKIRPITTDVSAFTTQVQGVTAKTFIEDILTNKVNNYKGTGRPNMYMDESLLVQVQLLKDDTGKYLFGDILSRESLASKIGVGEIITPDFLDGTGMAVMVNLNDYELAAPEKGRSQTYEDFDIDFNKHKYLIEGRVAGALNRPKSAIVFKSDSGSGDDGE